jgi:ATP-dependent Clp protease ATP-binding subunit ClpC
VRLTAAAEAAWMIAAGEAAASGHPRIEPGHLLIGVLSLGKIGSQADSGGLAVDAPRVRAENERLLAALAPLDVDTLRLRRRARSRLGRGPAPGPPAGPLSRSLTAKAIFAAASDFAGGEPIGIAHLLAALAEGVDALTAELVRSVRVDPAALRSAALRAGSPQGPAPAAGGTPILDRHGRDLTEAAVRGELPPSFGHEREILAVLRALGRGPRRSPVLVAETGMAKEAIVHGLARRAASAEAPGFEGRRLVALDAAALAGGARDPASAARTIAALGAELRSRPEVLLFLDDVHTVAAALAPTLARGELRLVGATTPEGWTQLEPFRRLFERVDVLEPDREETLEILRGLRPTLERHHDADLPDESLEAAVDLSMRFEVDRRLPDKAVDLLELAAAQAGEPSSPDASAARGGGDAGFASVVTATAVARALASKRGLPVPLVLRELPGALGARLGTLESALAARIAGQDEAIARVGWRLRIAFAAAPSRPGPLAVLLFAGPSGCGKTETARLVAEHLFGSPAAVIRVDGADLADGEAVARLTGAASDPRRSEERGLLAAAVRARPRAVLLLEQVEDADPGALDAFVQAVEQGRLTDASDRPADVRRLVAVLTSRLDEPALHRRLPGLVGRVDELVPYRALDLEDVAVAVGRAIAGIVAAAEARHGVRIRVSPEAARHVAERAAAEGPGASAARSTAERLVQGPIGALVVTGKLARHAAWKAVYDEGGVYVLPEG